MKKLYLFMVLITTLFSCSKEELSSIDQTIEGELVTFTYHYKNQSYNISFLDNGKDLTLVSDIPESLKNLGELPELATVINGSNIYYFDNEKEKFEYYGHNYSLLMSSREQSLANENYSISSRKNGSNISNSANSSSCCNHTGDFIQMANMHLDSYWGGSRMSISSLSQLKNLKNVNFNDKISSIRVDPEFYNPLGLPGSPWAHGARNMRRLIAYEHSNFGGRSYEVSGYKYHGNIVYVGHRRLKSLTYGFFGTKNWNDRISSFDILFNNTSVIPTSSGGGSGGSGGSGGGGGGGPTPIEDHR